MANMFSKIRDAITGTRDELDGTRRKISALKAEKSAIEKAPLSKDDALGQLESLIAHQAQQFETREANFAYLMHRSVDLTLAFGSMGSQASGVVSVGAICWLDPAKMRERLIAQLHKQWQSTPPGLPAPDRRQRITAIDAEILRLEQAEEKLIVEAAKHGIDLERRPDVDPRSEERRVGK